MTTIYVPNSTNRPTVAIYSHKADGFPVVIELVNADSAKGIGAACEKWAAENKRS